MGEGQMAAVGRPRRMRPASGARHVAPPAVGHPEDAQHAARRREVAATVDREGQTASVRGPGRVEGREARAVQAPQPRSVAVDHEQRVAAVAVVGQRSGEGDA